MKEKLSLILSAISLIGVLSVWVLWMCESIEFSVVSLDSFVGVIVALLAIIVTVAIGYQIVNAIEVKDEIKQLKQWQNIILENERKFAENDLRFTKMANNLQAGICDTNAGQYETKHLYIEAFAFFHSALSFAIRADQQEQMGRINHLVNIVSLISQKPTNNYVQLKQQIISDTEIIRETDSYRNCFGKEYEMMMLEFWDKMKQLGLESEEKSNDDGLSNNL